MDSASYLRPCLYLHTSQFFNHANYIGMVFLPKALRRIRREEPFDDRDAAFTSELVHGTLRARGRLDWALAQDAPAIYVVTNTRSLAPALAAALPVLDRLASLPPEGER